MLLICLLLLFIRDLNFFGNDFRSFEQNPNSAYSITDVFNNNITYYNPTQAESSKVYFIDCHFYDCQQSLSSFQYGNGGAVYISAISANISNCSFRDNYASRNGGALYIQSCARLVISKSMFDSNSAYNFCGATFLLNIFDCRIDLTNFSNNSAYEVSSLALSYCQNCSTLSLTFYNNLASKNSTIYIYKSKLYDEKSLFYSNKSEEKEERRINHVSGIFFAGESSATFYKTYLYIKNGYSVYVSNTDYAKFLHCNFLGKIHNAFFNDINANNNVALTDCEEKFGENFYYDYEPLIPYPTRPPEMTLSFGLSPDFVNNSSDSDSYISVLSLGWRILIFVSYGVVFCFLLYVFKRYFSSRSLHINAFERTNNQEDPEDFLTINIDESSNEEENSQGNTES